MSAMISCCERSRWSHGASDMTMKALLTLPPWPALAKVAVTSPESRSGWISCSMRLSCWVV